MFGHERLFYFLFGHKKYEKQFANSVYEICTRCSYTKCKEIFYWCEICQKITHESHAITTDTGIVCVDCLTGMLHDCRLN